MYRFLLLITLLTCTQKLWAQDELFGYDSSVKAHKGFIININASADVPMADMAKRFGFDYRLGPAITYKTRSNWIFGAKFDFLLGNKIKEDSFMINIKDKYTGEFNGKVVQFINVSGYRTGVPVYERGYLVGLSVGRIFNFNHNRPDNGLTAITTAGFIQHKINIFNRDKDVAELWGDYLKGYDRLTNGWFLEQYLGYSFFSRNGLLNFNLGLDYMIAFTQGRRDYQFDLMRPDNAKRIDMLLGVRGGWLLPIFRKKSDDLVFE